MKSSTSPTLIFLIQIVCLVVFLPTSHCRSVFFPRDDANLIDQTCQQTPNYDLCVSSLQSDPRRADADVKGLGIIMVDVVKARVTETLNLINELLMKSPGAEALRSCNRIYNAVLGTDILVANQAFVKDACENGFTGGGGGSPLLDMNKAILDLVAATAGIARTFIYQNFLNPFFLLGNMKNLIPLALTFLIQISLLPVSQCRPVYVPNDATLIDQTCQKTPDHNLCVSSLRSDPRSSSADVKGLGIIMVDVVKGKATDTLNQINDLLKQRPGDKSLSSCAEVYNTVITADVPEASQGFSLGNPKFAEQGMNDAAGEAVSCENGFSGSSPLTDKNKSVHDVAAVAAAIAKTLE
ncbi:hypothetical protein FF1_021775 [Malus domestica]